MANFDDFKLSIEALSGGKNTVLFDDREMPSVMVPFPKMKLSDLIKGGSDTVHPAFKVNNAEKDKLYVSKFQNIILNDRAYSLPGKDPAVSLNFDRAVTVSRNKGKGWSLMPYSLWCAIALWCRKNNTMPRGNNNYGSDHGYPHEKGVPSCAPDGSGKTQRTATGSGPATWYHNWMPDGIADMNGNVWEWCAGMRLKDGEIHIIPYADVFMAETSLLEGSTAWKAINKEGTLVEIGTEGTLKWDWVSGNVQLTDKAVTYETDQGNGASYTNMTLVADLTAPELAKALLLYPDDPKGDYGGDYHWLNTRGERLPRAGGSWSNSALAGVFDVHADNPRTDVSSGIGFRSAFCEGL